MSNAIKAGLAVVAVPNTPIVVIRGKTATTHAAASEAAAASAARGH